MLEKHKKKEAGIANYMKVLYQFIMCILLI